MRIKYSCLKFQCQNQSVQFLSKEIVQSQNVHFMVT